MADSNVKIEDVDVELTVDEAKAALTEILDALNEQHNIQRLEEARERAGNDMLKVMQLVFPIAAQIQADCIKHHGYSDNGQGAIKFALAVRSLEKVDSEVARLNKELKTHFIPQLTLPSFNT